MVVRIVVPVLVPHPGPHHLLAMDVRRIETEVIVDVTGAVVDAHPEAAHVGAAVQTRCADAKRKRILATELYCIWAEYIPRR